MLENTLKHIQNFLPSNVAHQIFQALPENIRQVKSDLEEEIKTILTSTFAKLDLVTREEFDIQTKVLQATRARVEALEKQIKMLHNMP